MSIALQAEREAIRRYTKLAASMHEGKNESAAALFERMVSEELEHERLLLEWMEQENISVNQDIPAISWRDPQISTVYNAEACDPYYSTPYRALAFAIHNEEIAFSFYTHVSADSENEAVRKYAEILAREELGHAALLRAERRHAYREQLETAIKEPMLDPTTIHNETDLLTAAIYIDRYLNGKMEALAEDSIEIDLLVRQTRQHISANEDSLNNMALNDRTSPGQDIINNLEQLTSYHAQTKKQSNHSDASLQQLCASCDHSFAFYDAVVETATNENVMLTAQKLTSSALDRIGILKQELGTLCTSNERNNKEDTA